MVVIWSGGGETDPNAGRPASYWAGRRVVQPEGKGGHGAIGETVDIPGELGETTPEQARAWMRAQIAYPNLAGDPHIAERATHFVRAQKTAFEQRTWEIQDKWRALDHMLRGNTLSRRFLTSDVHVPELYKAVEALVPRVQEAILQFDPWFSVRGRDRGDRLQADKIMAWLDYLLDIADFDHIVQPAIRSMLIYGFFAIKSRWDVEIREVVERDVKRTPDGGYKITPKLKEKIVYEGARLDLIDPYDFMADPREIDHQTSLFVGDNALLSIDDFHRAEDLGTIMNVSLIEGRKPKPQQYVTRRWSKIQRSLDSSAGAIDGRMIEGEPPKFESTELWAWFDPLGDDNYDQYVLQVVDQDVCVRVQKNPYDDRHRPYAIGRSAREPFDFYNVGPLDHASRINLELDEHRNLSLKSHALSQAPIVFMDDTDDTPDNIFEVEPGQIFRSRGKFEWIRVQSTVGEMQAMEQSLRRDIEEITGAMRLHENPSGTATEVERKIQESNRRIRAYVSAMTMGLEDLLGHLHAMSKQFVMRRQRFRVLGRSAKGLGEYSEVGPEDFQPDIDFEFVGPSSLHTMGLRGTNIATFLNLAFPLIQANPGRVNTDALLVDLYKTIVGVRPEEEIIQITPKLDELLSPEDENEMMLGGHEVDPHPAEDEQEHLEVHMDLVRNPRFSELHDHIQTLIVTHIMKTEQQQRTKMQQQGAQDRMQPAFPNGPMQTQNGTQKGRSGRSNDFAGSTPGQTVPGEAPGVPMLAHQAAPDRGAGIPQDENRF